MGKYLTPDTGDGVYLCRSLRFRAELAAFVTGALELLSHEWAWEQFGTMTPSEAAALATEALNYYLESGDNCMIGAIWQGITASVPEGVLELDGATYDVDDYPDLAAVLDAVFLNGDGTFTLPDARGRVGIGAGTGSGLTPRSVGDMLGAETHTLTNAESAEHAHGYLAALVTLGLGGVEVPMSVVEENEYSSTDNSGAGQPHNNMQPSIVWRVGVYWK